MANANNKTRCFDDNYNWKSKLTISNCDLAIWSLLDGKKSFFFFLFVCRNDPANRFASEPNYFFPVVFFSKFSKILLPRKHLICSILKIHFLLYSHGSEEGKILTLKKNRIFIYLFLFALSEPHSSLYSFSWKCFLC